MSGKKKAPAERTAPHSTREAALLVFDTETTGLPRNWRAPYTDTGNWPRLVSIAWTFLDGVGNPLGSRSYIVTPDGFEIPKEATKVHGITTKRALADGVPLATVLEDFRQSVAWADAVVAHNLEFDEAVTRCEAFRLGGELPFDDAAGLCTMKSTTEACRIPFPGGGRGYKYPTLSELHEFCFGKPHERAHDALSDVDAVVKVVQYLLESGQMVVELDRAR